MREDWHFDCQVCDAQGWPLKRQKLGNTLHYGGMALLLRRLFTEASPPSLAFKIGLDGRGCGGGGQFGSPNYEHPSGAPSIQPADGMNQIYNEGGFLTQWLAAMGREGGYERKDVSFSINPVSGGCHIETAFQTIQNAQPWSPRVAGLDPPQSQPHWLNDAGSAKAEWENVVGLPYQRPVIRSDADDGIPNQPTPLTDAWQLSWFSLNSLFLMAISGGQNHLIASAGSIRNIRLRPSQSFRVRCAARITWE